MELSAMGQYLLYVTVSRGSAYVEHTAALWRWIGY
jgi:hypothetical protein